MIALSHSTIDAQRRARAAARRGLPVLIVGETGTGKTELAQWLAADLGAEPLHAVNCAALPPELVSSELFGHARGAFTGAADGRAGLFGQPGALFLDELAELSRSSQGAILDVLQTGRYRRVGETRTRAMEAELLITATHSPEGLRVDLRGRLAAGVVHLDLLHRRPEDVEALVRLWLTEDDAHLDLVVHGALSTRWDYGARGLRAAIEHARVSCSMEGRRMDDDDLLVGRAAVHALLGDPPPAPIREMAPDLQPGTGDRVVATRLPDDLADRLKGRAEATDTTPSAVLRWLLATYI